MQDARWKQRGVGALAGLVAALLMLLVMVLLRTSLGISPPPEMIPDRLAPLLPVDLFFTMLGLAGGDNGLKQLGVGSILAGQLVVGALLGVAYAAVVARGRQGAAGGSGRFDVRRHGGTFVVAAIGLLWLATVALI